MNYISGFHRPFSLTDVAIAYPNKPDIVSISVLVIVALVVPAVVIVVLRLGNLLRHRDGDAWRRAFWEVHVGWLGLCVSLALTLFVTSGLKDVVGKPRPDLLARCQPRLTNITEYIVGGFGNSLNSEAESLVSSALCQQTDKRLLDDGFAAFPSGHSSFACAGLIYLSLWLCARFCLGMPYLDLSLAGSLRETDKRAATAPVRDKQASPPLWQTAFAITPILAALFICSSRYADFHHAGFDIIAGAVIGTVIGWTSFRFYHLPVRRGYGLLTWGPRKRRQAFLGAIEDDETPDEEWGRQQNHELGDLAITVPERAPSDISGDTILSHRNRRT